MSRIVTRRSWLTILLAACLFGLQGQAAAPQALAITDALSLYDRGSYSEFFDALSRDGAVDQNLFKTFEKDANAWTKSADVASRDRRSVVAASVALEIAHLLRDEPGDRAGRYLLWASLLMRRSPPTTPSATERLWYLASIAGMQELDEPWVLTAGAGTGSAVLDPIARAIGSGGQLAIAIRRFPDEPRFQLARAAFLEWRTVGRSEFVPSYVEFARTRAAVTVRDDPQSAQEGMEAGARLQAVVTLQSLAGISEVVRTFQAIGNDVGLRAEIELHVGYLENATMHWPSALDHLRRVVSLTDDAYLVYLSHYFTGRTLHNMGDPAAAVGAFERALAIVPNARSAATNLAAELLVSENAADRDRAYPLLQAAYSDPAPNDPWRLYACGDARLWPVYMTQLREALK
jgi:tetratricopeptide (TPR) repeat protein